MFEKRSQFTLNTEMVALNTPVFKDGIILDQHLKVNKADVKSLIQKIASDRQAFYEKEGIPDETVSFDLEAEISEHPDSLFVKCFAIKADEMNDNGDYFTKDELYKATSTFVGVPIFTNHQNSDINQARGKVVHSWWDDDKNGIMVIARVDAEAYPQLARGIKEEYIMGTSMGCQVKYSICSICHNVAESPGQYCSHIRERKTRTISAKNQKCSYHEYGKEKNCPVCGSTKKEAKSFDVHDQQVYEYNYGIKFIENSFVVNPACHDCGVTEIIDPQKFLAKVANLQQVLPSLIKAANKTTTICTDKICATAASDAHMKVVLDTLDYLQSGAEYIKKIAGQDQINDLNQALNLLTSVSQDMLQQKDQIDLEFLSDLVKVLSDLQTVTDELREQGYGRLPSPGQQSNSQQPNAAPGGQQPSVQPGTPNANPTGGASKVHSGPAGDAGTVTGPLAANKKKQINLEKWSKELLSKTKAGRSFLLSHQIDNDKKSDDAKSLKLRLQVGRK